MTTRDALLVPHAHRVDSAELLVLLGEAHGHERRLTVHGELDVESSPRLAAELAELTDDAALVVLDLTGVAFVDSSALRVLVHAANRLEERGGQLLVEGLSPAVQRVLEITGTLERFRAAD